jgi:hypothetical protein
MHAMLLVLTARVDDLHREFLGSQVHVAGPAAPPDSAASVVQRARRFAKAGVMVFLTVSLTRFIFTRSLGRPS